MKLSPMEAYSDQDLTRIAESFNTRGAEVRASGTAAPPEWGLLARALEYIVVLRKTQGKKEPGAHARAVKA